MSNVERAPATQLLTRTDEPATELLEPREVPLGGPRAMLVRRSLPNRNRRMVGAWCFVDTYGPTDIVRQAGMQVPPHPHTGLQTVSWLLDGEVWHQDSVGSRQLVRPGELNLMTAGYGVAHSEESLDRSPALHGVQLWVALPAEYRDSRPHFEHHAELPTLADADGSVTVIMGRFEQAVSPARTYSPLIGADVSVTAGARLRLALEPDFEHAVLALSKPITVDGQRVPVGSMRYLNHGRREVLLEATDPARALLIGGVPFDERLMMWWNFIGPGHDEIVDARTTWERERTSGEPGGRFGTVPGYGGPALPAPSIPNARLRATGRYRRRT
ncbi:MAG: pirin family protein [Pseudonocardiaceae bacterium]|nr:pirin family protein [Pseudonocardiaceae bacterium]